MISRAKSSFTAVELFAGVGGFRLGLEKSGWEVIWSNQWEPATKIQHASQCYESNFSRGIHVCENITRVIDDLEFGDNNFEIPKFDLVVGGFPCQDYSVAKTANQAQGINGKKGVLWWDIHRLLRIRRPKYFFLENVDRLLKSPASQRGRDFAIMLASVADLGYSVEWRVINAADYGFPQRRRRVFIVGVLNDLLKDGEFRGIDWITKSGIIPEAFPVYKESRMLDEFDFQLSQDLVEITNKFGIKSSSPTFQNSGVMNDFEVWTLKTEPKYRGNFSTLLDVLVDEEEVPKEFYISSRNLRDWKYLKGSKREERTHKSGGKYFYSEGAIAFPDSLEAPSRTILTGEGGTSASRFKHVIQLPDGRFRRLVPVELERLNGFPDNWTIGMSDTKRAFMMGNALVVGVVAKIANSLLKFAKTH